MKKFILIIVASLIVSLPTYSQINIGNMKNQANKYTNKTPSNEEAEKAGHLKNCEKELESIKEKLVKAEKSIEENNLEDAEMWLRSVNGSLMGMDPGDDHTGCPEINKSKEQQKYDELMSIYEEKSGSAQASADYMESDLEFVKQAVWSLDPLKNQIDFGNIGMFDDLTEAELFYSNCKDVDFINTAPDLISISKKYPEEFQPDYEMTDYVEDFTVKFPAYLEKQLDFLKNEINSAMVEANKLKGRSDNFLEDAMNMSNAALTTANACMILYPDNKEIIKLQETASNHFQSISKEFAVKTYTSDIHAQNAGKIVFSTDIIKISSENAASFKNSFNSSETVYAMVYLKTNLSAIQGTGFITTKISANGTQIAEHQWKASGESSKNTYSDAEIMPLPATAETYGALKFYEAFNNSLLPGSNTIKVSLLDNNNNIVAEGEFTLDCSGGIDAITSRYNELREIRLEKVRMPAASMSNPALEASILSAMGAQNWEEKAIRAVITGDSWITHRGALGEILFREIYSAVAFKTPEGKCKIFYMSFKQAYNGSTYGITKYYSVGGSEEIKCGNVNK
jgi:hypothetical protein